MKNDLNNSSDRERQDWEACGLATSVLSASLEGGFNGLVWFAVVRW